MARIDLADLNRPAEELLGWMPRRRWQECTKFISPGSSGGIISALRASSSAGAQWYMPAISRVFKRHAGITPAKFREAASLQKGP